MIKRKIKINRKLNNKQQEIEHLIVSNNNINPSTISLVLTWR